jgi:thymidylate synthase
MWNGFSCITSKKVFWKGAIAELIWMARGSTNVFELSEILYGDPNKPNFWTPNYELQAKNLGYDRGYLGPVYGKQLVDFNGVNQLQYVIDLLKTDMYSRRAVISMWNPADLPAMALPPCHYSSVFNAQDIGVERILNMTVIMRSNDLFLGAPFNYVFYGALLECICEAVGHGLVPGVYSHISVNSHIYQNQSTQVETQLERKLSAVVPDLWISPKARALLREKGA